MKKQSRKELSRRRFLGTAAIGMAGITLLPSLSSCSSPKKADDKIRLGFIGMGRQAMFLLNGFIQIPGVRVIAGCDVYGRKRQRFENRVNEFYSKNNVQVEVKTYEKYQDLLQRNDIDAVVIAVPDHAHAMIAIAACKAGKDVYLEKPMTFTIKEGQELRRVVRENDRILAIGSQQRSDPNFQHAIKMVHTGRLGEIQQVNAYVGAPPVPYNLPKEEIPADLNWDLWLGPLPGDIHFNNELNPPISLDPVEHEKIWGAWRWYKEMGGGFTTDWGAHMFDIGQWGLGMDESGPVEISPVGDGTEYMQFKYANGVVMTSEPFNEQMTKGVKFTGTDGWLEVSRGHFVASDDSLLPPKSAQADDDTPYETKIPHQINFIEAVRNRVDPVVPVEVGHRTCTVCTLGNIACDLKRTIKWDPATETFVDDQDGAATAHLHYQYRDGWTLL
ncbi:Gfo/Idh/MocA family protein [Sunxiuqinia elliptica]|uniref:Putative dehydrogenase n=1 Tax=Sunxiuqinia elliptica TaxID=655355 RepID=A0A4R6H6J8_9BACT|nr:Gfo/Idh/MocA family oxidoreductase [Sunxiuqinia elliptica]TDO03075.1 putative dehydrogenase [Sunxiuqinia elliptica]TDO59274.1 putative dehydrogenase [Sunxiuqinia elliptica]